MSQFQTQPWFAGGPQCRQDERDHGTAVQLLVGLEQALPIQRSGSQDPVAVNLGLLQQHAQQAGIDRVHQPGGSLHGRLLWHDWQFKTTSWQPHRW